MFRRRHPPSDSAPPARPETSPRTLALRYLARRDYTSQELAQKLIARGVDPDAAAEAVSNLASSGLVDDRRAAAAHVRTASRVKGRGPHRIRLELQARGLAPGAIKDALDALPAEEVEETLERIVTRKHPTRPISRDDRDRLFRQLLRRGFSSAAIEKALK